MSIKVFDLYLLHWKHLMEVGEQQCFQGELESMYKIMTDLNYRQIKNLSSPSFLLWCSSY